MDYEPEHNKTVRNTFVSSPFLVSLSGSRWVREQKWGCETLFAGAYGALRIALFPSPALLLSGHPEVAGWPCGLQHGYVLGQEAVG